MIKTADFSPCRKYRYTLWRVWGDNSPRRTVMFIGLNPSTADETLDDPTIRRCINYAKDWGYDGMCMTNLFAYRATQPADMKMQQDPCGHDNNDWLLDVANVSSLIVAAWGTHGTHLGRDRQVRNLFSELHCLKLTKHEHPAHPLYLPKTLTPVIWA